MKTLVFELLKRAAWAYVLLAAAVLCLLGFFPFTKAGELLNMLGLVAYFGIFAGPVLLSLWFMRGAARVLLSLPISLENAGRSCWIVGVGVPLLFLASMWGLGSAVFWWWGLPLLTMESTLVLGGAALGYIGTMFFLLTLMPARPDASMNWQLKGVVIGGGWGLLAGAGPLVSGTIAKWQTWDSGHWLIFAAGLLLAGLGWLQAPRMLLRRARSAPDETGGASSRRERLPAAGAGGIGLLLRFSISRTLRIAAAMGVVLWLMQTVLFDRHQSGTPRLIWSLGTMAIFSSFMVVQWFGALRHFRSLPISSLGLTGLLCAIVGLPAVLIGGGIVTAGSFFASDVLLTSITNAVLLYASACILIPSLVLASGNMKVAPFVLAFFIGGQMAFMPSLAGLRLEYAAAISLAGAAVGAGLIYWSIDRGSRCYRPSAFIRL